MHPPTSLPPPAPPPPPLPPIHPSDFTLKLKMNRPLRGEDPSAYVTSIEGQIRLRREDRPDRTAGRLRLTLFDLNRAELEGQNPMEVFDCFSQEALELYQALYEGDAFNEAVQAVAGEAWNPSLLVLESIEVLPRFRGGGLGLAVSLMALQQLGPVGGMAALLAAPITQPFWHPRMKMEAFPPDSPQVRQTLGTYWEQLGFKLLGTSGWHVRNLENLPRIGQLHLMQR